MFQIGRNSATTDAPYFAREVYVNSNNQIIVDGQEVAMWGIKPRQATWAGQLRLLLRWRRVYVIPRSCGGSIPLSVTLFTGRGDLASYLIWSGDATATSIAYGHVQLAAIAKKTIILLISKSTPGNNQLRN